MKIIEKNGCVISEVTLGTVQLGMNYGINNNDGKPSQKEAEKILSAAVRLGIKSYDTSNDYGNSENILGDYFSKSKEKATFITKIGPNSVSEREIRDEIEQSVKKSMDNLKTDTLPFLLLHSEKYLIENGKSIKSAMLELKREGIVKNIGVSFSDKSNIIELFDTEVFDSIQIPLNLFDNKEMRDGTLKKLSEKNITIFTRSAYLQGLFFKNPDELPEKLQVAKDCLVQIKDLAKRENMSVAQLAISFLRGEDTISSLLLGCEKSAQIEEIAYLLTDRHLSDKVRGEIFDISEKIPSIVIRPWEWNK